MYLEPRTEKRKSWYEETVEEEEANARLLAEGPATILAAKFSQAVSFSSPVGTQPPRPTSLLQAVPEPRWDGSHPPLSEALDLDWTAEDQVAYHAMEPALGEDPLALDNDDLLGEEFEESLKSASIPVIPALLVSRRR